MAFTSRPRVRALAARIGKHMTKDQQDTFMLLHDAVEAIGEEVKEQADHQAGRERQNYAFVIWLAGLTRADFDRLKAVWPEGSHEGDWDIAEYLEDAQKDTAIPRGCAVCIGSIEARESYVALGRCQSAIARLVVQADLHPRSCRIEVEPFWRLDGLRSRLGPLQRLV